MEDKVDITFKDPEGNVQTRWLYKNEWDFLVAFRHKRNAYFWKFGCRATGLGNKITKEENKLFEEWYSETYPEKVEILNRVKENEQL